MRKVRGREQPWMLWGISPSFMKGMYYYPDKTKDFGFAGHMAGGFKYYKSKEIGCA